MTERLALDLLFVRHYIFRSICTVVAMYMLETDRGHDLVNWPSCCKMSTCLCVWMHITADVWCTMLTDTQIVRKWFCWLLIVWLWINSVQHCAALCCDALCWITLHSAALHCALLCSTVLCVALHCTVQHCAKLHGTVVCSCVLCNAMLHYTALCCTVLHCFNHIADSGRIITACHYPHVSHAEEAGYCF